MALNTLKCNHLMPLPFKGLNDRPTLICSFVGLPCIGEQWIECAYAQWKYKQRICL